MDRALRSKLTTRGIVVTLALSAGVALSIFGSPVFGSESRPYSPERIDPPYMLDNERPPGSRHAFGYGVVYEVVDHRRHDGKTYAIVTSHEPGVEIWTPLQPILRFGVGTRFHLVQARTLDEAFQKIPVKNH